MMLGEHFTKTVTTVPRFLIRYRSSTINEPVSPKKERTGLLSSFAQFLSISSSEYDENNPEQMRKFEAAAKHCIKSCQVEDLLNDTRFMEIETLTNLVQTIISLSYHKNDDSVLPTATFSESSVFLLELLFKILARNRDRLKSIWPLVSVHLETIISPSSQPILIERASTNILRLLMRLTKVEHI
jgi:hypothetical protein